MVISVNDGSQTRAKIERSLQHFFPDDRKYKYKKVYIQKRIQEYIFT